MIGEMLYIAGPPGVGKSTLARELTAGWDRQVVGFGRVPHVRLGHPSRGRVLGIELGVPRAEFPGTDSLSMSIGPAALDFLTREVVFPFALGEGSRLATRPFLGGLVHAGVRLTFVSLGASQDVLDYRWRARGSKQNPSWRKGAATRAERMHDWAKATEGVKTIHLPRVDEMDPDGVLDLIRGMFPLIDLRESAA